VREIRKKKIARCACLFMLSPSSLLCHSHTLNPLDAKSDRNPGVSPERERLIGWKPWRKQAKATTTTTAAVDGRRARQARACTGGEPTELWLYAVCFYCPICPPCPPARVPPAALAGAGARHDMALTDWRREAKARDNVNPPSRSVYGERPSTVLCTVLCTVTGPEALVPARALLWPTLSSYPRHSCSFSWSFSGWASVWRVQHSPIHVVPPLQWIATTWSKHTSCRLGLC
jgi:hypothetical protein